MKLREFERRARRDTVKDGERSHWIWTNSFISRRLKDMNQYLNQKVTCASVSYSQFLRKSGYIIVFTDLQQPPT